MLSENQSIQFNPNFTQPTIISLDNNNDKKIDVSVICDVF